LNPARFFRGFYMALSSSRMRTKLLTPLGWCAILAIVAAALCAALLLGLQYQSVIDVVVR
jgi:hypothetical protein